jgi:hypothetical protein
MDGAITPERSDCSGKDRLSRIPTQRSPDKSTRIGKVCKVSPIYEKKDYIVFR